MNDNVKVVVNLADMPLQSESHGDRFSVQVSQIGLTLGLTSLGCMLHVVPAGKTAFPFHRHHGSDEMFLVLSGAGEYRFGETRLPVRAGDCLGAPAGGEAHQIFNTGTEDLRYLGFSNEGTADLVEYPDSGKISARVGSKGLHHTDATFVARGRMALADYWDGEEG